MFAVKTVQALKQLGCPDAELENKFSGATNCLESNSTFLFLSCDEKVHFTTWQTTWFAVLAAVNPLLYYAAHRYSKRPQ